MTQPTAPTGNPFLNGTAGTAASPPTVDAFGLTSTDLAAPVVLGAGQSSWTTIPDDFGRPLRVQEPGQPELDPFGIGIPLKADGGSVTAQSLLNYIQSLTPDQIGQVQAELANAGYYGPVNSLTSEPHWGQLSTTDGAAIGRFVKDAIVGAQNGSTLSSVLARATAQWNTSQQNDSSLTPVKNLGKNYTITNLDPNMAGSMVDQASMKVLGKTLPQSDRLQKAGWLNQLFTNRQTATDQGDINQNQMNAAAVAQASDFIDPVTGRAIDHNGVTATARSQMGVQYQWGAQSPGKAFDCSGLTQWVYGQNGIKIPRTSQEQWLDPAGTKFNDMSQAAPGDLVFFGGPYGPGHVGIYIGNGMMIDAPHTGSSVRLDNVQSFASGDALVGFKHYAQVANTSVGGSSGSNMASFLAAEREQESGGNYQARNSIGASGAYQFMQGTWNTYAKQVAPQWVGRNPADAPAAVQDQVATQMASQLYSKYGNFGDVASAWYSGRPLSQVDAKAAQNGGPSIGDYVNSVMAKMTANGGDTSGDPNATGSLDANGGRSVLSTPNTFTNATDESSAALQASLEAQLRAENPAMAQAHDMTNAYTMLAKSLRDGITVNNS